MLKRQEGHKNSFVAKYFVWVLVHKFVYQNTVTLLLHYKWRNLNIIFQSLPFHIWTREQKANISFSKYFDPGNTKPDVQSCFSFSTYLATEIAMAMFNLIYFACKCVETHQQKWQFMALKKRVISYMLFHSAP